MLGGPATFSQTCGDHTSVLRMHCEEGDLSDLGRRFVDCFVAAMDDAGLPADPEFRAAMRGYLEWATGAIVGQAASGAPIRDGLRMPSWSWDGPAS